MHIEHELRNWLEANIPNRQKEKSRNIQIVLNFYGFGDLAWPTLESIANQLSIGTRERVRQIINSSFRNKISNNQLPTANSIFTEIEKYKLISIPDLRRNLSEKGLASTQTTVRGLLTLARDFNRCEKYNLYDSSLATLARSEAEFDSNTFLIHAETLPKLKRGLKKARTLPGLLGLSRFEYLASELNNNDIFENVLAFIRESAKAVQIKSDDQTWYIYEDRDNTLINCCEKIFSLTERLNIEVLSSTLQNSLRRRSHKYEYPSSKIISEWIELSRWFKVSGHAVEFLGERTRELTDVEQSVVDYLSQVDYSLYPPFKDHLLSKGNGKPTVDKAITTSPLVSVDKSGQRKTYRYTLISKAGLVSSNTESLDRYQKFKNRLKSLLATGTDSIVEGISRKEQLLLREWLFDNQHEADCAICGERFNVSALITAHKKKRSICSDAERVDPYIVFPSCVFGCDYLYESRTVKILDGTVVFGNKKNTETEDIHRALSLCGNRLDKKWVKGSSSYFDDNSLC